MRFAGALALAFTVAITVPATARANGAFPDSQTVITPAGRPQEILLVTNFGVLISQDGGTSWQWSCERDGNALGILYQRGPAPRRRLFTVANDKLAFSDDDTCRWTIAGGSLVGRVVTDFFPDPSDGNRVLAVGFGDARYAVSGSSDGGETFGPVVYQAADGDGIGGVEIARSDPATIYVSMTTATDTHPVLVRSSDNGEHWTRTDLFAELGPGLLRIIGIDPQDANVVLLRWMGANSQAVAITRDGGATATKILTVDGNLTAFVRLGSDTLLAAALVEPGTTAILRRSRDGGASFEVVERPPMIRALSERDGLVYAATDNFGDGYALGVSADEGATWTGVMSYDQVDAILPCLRADPICQSTCHALAGMGDMTPGMIWTDAVCSADPPDPLPPPSGCGCAHGGGDSDGGDWPPVVIAISLVSAAARRTRTSRLRPASGPVAAARRDP